MSCKKLHTALVSIRNLLFVKLQLYQLRFYCLLPQTNRCILSTLAQTMCLEILDAYFAGLSINPLLQNRKDKIFQKFLQDCFRNFKSHRDVKFYAALQNLTPRYFATVIHEVSGKTPIEWLNLSVIAEAKKLLTDPNLSIKEIAMLLNFEDQSLFGRYFKNKVGASPQKFRGQMNIQ